MYKIFNDGRILKYIILAKRSMDLRPYKPTPEQILEATHLACRGLLCYQPFTFSDGLMTGAGYEFAGIAEGAGLVYCTDVPSEYSGNASVDRHLIDTSLRDKFIEGNQRLQVLYETMLDLVENKVGSFSDLTCADIGCCSGYFPLSFAQRGAKQAVGYDAIDYTPTYKLLNSLLGTNAEFRNQPYVSELGAIKGGENDRFDVVFSIAVLVHLSDPLQHLAFLGRMARKAIVVWTYTSEDSDEDLVLRFRSVNRYYSDKKFPYCFDVVQLSPGLLKRSLELMGFTEIYPIENCPEGMPDFWFKRQHGYLAIRGEESQSYQWSDEELEKNIGPVSGFQSPQLIASLNGYNIVAFKGKYFGVPQSLGPMDLSQVDIASLDGVIVNRSEEIVRRAIEDLASD